MWIPYGERHLIGPVPSAKRTVELGNLEQQYARQAVDHVSSGLLFAGVSLAVKDVQDVVNQVPIALRAMQKRHPMLRCRLGKRRERFVLEEDPDFTLPFEIRPRNGTPQAWREVWTEEFEPQRTRLGDACLKAMLFLDANDATHCELALALQHYAADGISAAFLMHEFIHLIANRISANEVEYGNWEVAFDETRLLQVQYPRSPLSHFGKRVETMLNMGQVVLGRGITALPFAPGHDGLQLFRDPKQMVEQSRTQLIDHLFSESETMALTQRCRVERCSVTCAVAAAFSAAQAEAIQGHAKTFGSSVSVMCSMREIGRVSNADCIAPHVSSVSINLFGSKQNLWAVARDLYAALQGASNEDKLWFSKHSLQYMTLLPMGQNLVRLPNMALSSWGSNAIKKEYASGTVRVLGSFFAQNARQVSLPTLSMNNMLENRLNIVCLSPMPRLDPGLMQRAFQLGLKNLSDMMTDLAKL